MNMKVMCVSTLHPQLFSSFCISGSEGGLAISGHGYWEKRKRRSEAMMVKGKKYIDLGLLKWMMMIKLKNEWL